MRLIGYGWFHENINKRKYRRKEQKNKERKIKNIFKINKLFLYAISKSFHLF